jgi:hypothetical protein
MQGRRAAAVQRTSFCRSEESGRVQPANNFAIHRASLARCGPSISAPATAPVEQHDKRASRRFRVLHPRRPRPLEKASPADAARAIVAGIIAGNDEIFPDKVSQGTGPAFFADPKGLERQVTGVPAAA